MADEWNVVELRGPNRDGEPMAFTVGANMAVSQGTMMALKDPRACSAATITDTVFAGIAAMEKLAAETNPRISLWTNGIFDVVSSGAILIGKPVVGIGYNMVKEPTSGAITDTGAGVIGIALEASGGDAERINIRVNL